MKKIRTKRSPAIFDNMCVASFKTEQDIVTAKVSRDYLNLLLIENPPPGIMYRLSIVLI